MIPTLNIENALELPTCRGWPRNRIVEVYQGRDLLTLDQLLTAGIPVVDLLWVLMREPWLNDAQMFQIAGEFVRLLEGQVEPVAADLACKAAAGAVGPGHVRHPGDSDVVEFWRTATPGMLAAHYAGLWAAMTVKDRSIESADVMRSRQLDLVVGWIREVHHGA